MAVGTRDLPFAALAGQDRPVLLGTAYLLLGDRTRAGRVVDAVLAGVHRRWSRLADPRRTALLEVVTADPQTVRLPWVAQDRFELVDGGPVTGRAPSVVADLAQLPPVQRTVVVLTAYAGLAAAEVAALLDLSEPEVAHATRLARFALGAREPGRLSDVALSAELREAVPPDLRAPTDGAQDVANGHRLARRGWG
ncbi:MAG: polymerase, sigma-24 subunit, subfamily, partial [Friedmanniella sp.]|nr:polymerase, sigma-24 subunit, subfamily [Friedmanniella sp.]